MAKSIVDLQVVVDKSPAQMAEDLFDSGQYNLSQLARRLSQVLAAVPVLGGKIQARVDSVTETAATITITCDQGAVTAEDKVVLHPPGMLPVILTAKSSAAVAASGEFDAITDDATMATNLHAALVAYPHAKEYFTASVDGAVVTVTTKSLGSGANSYKATAIVDSGTPFTFSGSGSFAGGDDALDQPTASVVITHASLVTAETQPSLTNTITQASLVDATDTLVIGAVTLTWKTTPSGENEVAIGASDTEAGDNLEAKINAHSVLGSRFLADNVAGVVTITYIGDTPEDGEVISISEAGTGQVLSAATFTGGASQSSITIGDVTLSFVTTETTENHVDNGADATAAGDNLVAAIADHSVLGSLFSGSNVTGTVTISYKGDPRSGSAFAISVAGAGLALTGSDFSPGATVVAQSATYKLG